MPGSRGYHAKQSPVVRWCQKGLICIKVCWNEPTGSYLSIVLARLRHRRHRIKSGAVPISDLSLRGCGGTDGVHAGPTLFSPGQAGLQSALKSSVILYRPIRQASHRDLIPYPAIFIEIPTFGGSTGLARPVTPVSPTSAGVVRAARGRPPPAAQNNRQNCQSGPWHFEGGRRIGHFSIVLFRATWLGRGGFLTNVCFWQGSWSDLGWSSGVGVI